MYLYLIYDKAEALDAFKTYKTEVENQHEKKIKIVRSDRGGNTTESIQNMGNLRVHLRDSLKVRALLHNILCPAHLNKMVLLKEGIAR